MISVVVCSRSATMFASLEKNIRETIGMEFEIIRIDNSANKYSICKAYNEGAEKSTHPFLCFVHEDVAFKTMGWGAALAGYFKADENLGLLGLGGSLYKSSFPSGWGAFDKATDFVNICMPLEDGETGRFYTNPGGGSLTRAMVIDGVLLFTTREIWREVKFSEAVKGFHFYDIDFSLRLYKKGYVAAVENTIEVVHSSRGRLDDNWVKAALAYHRENKKFIRDVMRDAGIVKKNSDEALQTYWLKRLSKFYISLPNRMSIFFSYRFYFTKSYIKTCYRFLKYPGKQA